MKKEKKYQQDPYRMRPIQMAGWSGRAISIAVNVIVLMQITFYCTNILAMSPVLVWQVRFLMVLQISLQVY